MASSTPLLLGFRKGVTVDHHQPSSSPLRYQTQAKDADKRDCWVVTLGHQKFPLIQTKQGQSPCSHHSRACWHLGAPGTLPHPPSASGPAAVDPAHSRQHATAPISAILALTRVKMNKVSSSKRIQLLYLILTLVVRPPHKVSDNAFNALKPERS